MQLINLIPIVALLIPSIASQSTANDLPKIIKEKDAVKLAFKLDQVPQNITVTMLESLVKTLDGFKKDEESNKNKDKSKDKNKDEGSNKDKDQNKDTSNGKDGLEGEVDRRETDKEKEGTKFEYCNEYKPEPGMDIKKMLNMVNEIRAKVGSPKLILSVPLIRSAVYQSSNQQSTGVISHDGPDGGWKEGMPVTKRNANMGKRAFACKFAGFPTAENVAMGQEDIESVIKSWMDSKGHRENIENKANKYFGAAKVGKFWTQTFGV